MTDAHFARQVQEDGIDILIDLAGHSPGNRLGVFARKPAPVQVSMLDSFDTSGMTAIDYFVSDHCSSPPDSGQRFTERLLRLSSPRMVYCPSGEQVAVAPAPVLKNGQITFGSFNRIEKTNSAVSDLWAEILSKVSGSRLILKDRSLASEAVAQSYRHRFRDHGIEPSRLDFRTWSDHRQLMEEYADVDIALDPFPYNGGLTTCEALWMGVPVIALAGSRIIGRQSTCFLRAVGLDDFVGRTTRVYVERAVHWAGRVEALAKIRTGLRQRVAGSALMDARRYAGELEEQFITILQNRAETG